MADAFSSQPAASIQLRLLGPFELLRDGAPVAIDRYPRRARRLLRLLAAVPEHRRLRDVVIDSLWPDAAPEAGASNLRYTFHLLRRAFGPDRPAPVLSEDDWVLLNPAYRWEIDLDEFAALVRGDDAAALAQAIALCRGEALIDDRYESWATPIRERIEHAWRDACLHLAALAREQGELVAAAQWLEPVLEKDPLDEEAVQRQLVVLAEQGHRTNALRRFQLFRQRLANEFDLAPEPETLAIVQRLKEQASRPRQNPTVNGPARTAPFDSSYLFPATGPLLGRADELREIMSMLTSAGRDSPHLFLVAAEAGLGKSRLLGEVVRQARAGGLLTLAGGCYEQEGQLPYGPLHDALLEYFSVQSDAALRALCDGLIADLARIVPEIGVRLKIMPPTEHDGADDQRLRLFAAVAELFRRICAAYPVVVLVDDLHWADPASLQLIHFLVRRLRTNPLFIVGAYRDDEVQGSAPLGMMVGELMRVGLARLLPLMPLARSDLGQLLDRWLGGECSGDLADHLYARSDGNPLFAHEMAQYLKLERRLERRPDGWRLVAEATVDLPPAVREAIARRLRQFPPQWQAVLACGAILGSNFAYQALEAIWTGDEEDLLTGVDAALASRLVRETAAGYAFRHPLYWEVLYRSLPAARRANMHRRAVHALEVLYGSHADDHAAELARHAVASGDRTWALRYTLAAGDRASRAFANEEAERQYRSALDFAGELSDAQGESNACERLGQVLRRIGRYDEALDLLTLAATARHNAGDLDGEGRDLVQIGWTHFLKGSREDGWASIRTGLDTLAGRISPAVQAALQSVLANLLNKGDRAADQLAAAEAAIGLARAAGEKGIEAEAATSRGQALELLGRCDDALRDFEEAILLAEEAGDLHTVVRAAVAASTVRSRQGKFAAAKAFADRGLAVARTQGDLLQVTYLTSTLGHLAFCAGDWSEALRRQSEAVDLVHILGQSRISAVPLMDMGMLCLRRGKRDEAIQYLNEALHFSAYTGRQDAKADAQALLAEADLQVNRASEAVGRLESQLQAGGKTGLMSHLFRCILAEVYLALGEVAQAEVLVTAALERTRTRGELRRHVELLNICGDIRARSGRQGDAVTAFREVIALARDMPYPYAEARAQLQWGRMVLEQGAIREGSELARQALTIFRQLGAGPDIQRAESMLKQVQTGGTNLA